MELLDIVDENNRLTGRKEDREKVHTEGLWHREVAIWIMNEKGEILLQKRAATKKQAPNKWAITAGHIDAGEEPLQAVRRETLEEIGLGLKESDLEFLFVEKMEKKFLEVKYHNRMFNYLYLARTNKEISEFVIQQEELSELKYINLKELEDIIEHQDEEYVFSKSPYIPKLISILKNKEENL